MYETAADVTGVLVARAAGVSFEDALQERICEPLGMKDTAFSVRAETISRLATAYVRDDATGTLVVEDGPAGTWSRPPAFEGGGGGLVSTADSALESCKPSQPVLGWRHVLLRCHEYPVRRLAVVPGPL